MRGKFFSRARFAYVIQKPISWLFAYLAYLDGDSDLRSASVGAKRMSTGHPAPPFPRLPHNEIVLFGFHEDRVRSVIQRMPGMLTHKKSLIPDYSG